MALKIGWPAGQASRPLLFSGAVPVSLRSCVRRPLCFPPATSHSKSRALLCRLQREVRPQSADATHLLFLGERLELVDGALGAGAKHADHGLQVGLVEGRHDGAPPRLPCLQVCRDQALRGKSETAALGRKSCVTSGPSKLNIDTLWNTIRPGTGVRCGLVSCRLK